MYGVLLKESKGNFIPCTLSSFPEKEHQRLFGLLTRQGLFTRAGNGEIYPQLRGAGGIPRKNKNLFRIKSFFRAYYIWIPEA